MSVLLKQLLTEYTDSSGARITLEEAITPATDADPSYPRAFYHPRTPDVITTRGWLYEGKLIKCFCNPSAATWSIPRRETMQKTAGGVVRNTWRNRYRNSYFDAFPVALSFQSGNIMPSAAYDPAMVSTDMMVADRNAMTMPAGLHNFYKFLNLLDQPALGGSQANYHIVVYHSRIFPELWLEGWFQPEGVNWRDEGNSVNWEATMLVTRTVPQLSNFDLMQGLYTDWVRNNAMSEVVPSAVLAEIDKKRVNEAFAASLPAYIPPAAQPTSAQLKEDIDMEKLKKDLGMAGSVTKNPSKVASYEDDELQQSIGPPAARTADSRAEDFLNGVYIGKGTEKSPTGPSNPPFTGGIFGSGT